MEEIVEQSIHIIKRRGIPKPRAAASRAVETSLRDGLANGAWKGLERPGYPLSLP